MYPEPPESAGMWRILEFLWAAGRNDIRILVLLMEVLIFYFKLLFEVLCKSPICSVLASLSRKKKVLQPMSKEDFISPKTASEWEQLTFSKLPHERQS
jgi:hypothetical protein